MVHGMTMAVVHRPAITTARRPSPSDCLRKNQTSQIATSGKKIIRVARHKVPKPIMAPSSIARRAFARSRNRNACSTARVKNNASNVSGCALVTL